MSACPCAIAPNLRLLREIIWVMATRSARPPLIALLAAVGASARVVRHQPVTMMATAHTDSRMKNSVFFIMGGPGSGKGTQCEMLEQRFGLCHLSAGELLRDEAQLASDRGQQIAKIMAEGQIVPSEVTVELLVKAMRERDGPFLIDGFPRSIANLRAYEECMDPCEFMLFLDLSEDVMSERLLSRAKVSGRTDDNAQTIRKRFETYRAETLPVIDAMRTRGLLRTVSGDGSPAAVFGLIAPYFEEVLGVAEYA